MSPNDLDDLFARLARSTFRSRFRLKGKELAYYRQKGEAVIREHAEAFIRERLAPAEPANDGKQTPMRNHPVFVAQHATATCCRGCLAKWHGIPQGRQLTDNEVSCIIAAIIDWLNKQYQTTGQTDFGQRGK
jgi:hypothetical protein